jgi:hypothetical protein
VSGFVSVIRPHSAGFIAGFWGCVAMVSEPGGAGAGESFTAGLADLLTAAGVLVVRRDVARCRRGGGGSCSRPGRSRAWR